MSRSIHDAMIPGMKDRRQALRSVMGWCVATSCGMSCGTRAIAQVPPHDPATQMLPDARGAVPWSLLSATQIKRTQGRLAPDFSTALRRLDGRTVKVQGYLFPLEAGQMHKRFLLSAWSPTCPFCQTAGPEAMIDVMARTPVPYDVDPQVLQGKLVLLDQDASGMFYRLVDAIPARLP